LEFGFLVDFVQQVLIFLVVIGKRGKWIEEGDG
jgi:hypothetical protein